MGSIPLKGISPSAVATATAKDKPAISAAPPKAAACPRGDTPPLRPGSHRRRVVIIRTRSSRQPNSEAHVSEVATATAQRRPTGPTHARQTQRPPEQQDPACHRWRPRSSNHVSRRPIRTCLVFPQTGAWWRNATKQGGQQKKEPSPMTKTSDHRSKHQAATNPSCRARAHAC